MKTCLVVDDSSVIRKVARRILEGLEFKIAEAENGEEAIEACRVEIPDAILLDWNMPKMDGYDFLRALRRDKKALSFFKALNRANLYSISYRLQTAKTPETRARRTQKILAMLARGEKFH